LEGSILGLNLFIYTILSFAFGTFPHHLKGRTKALLPQLRLRLWPKQETIISPISSAAVQARNLKVKRRSREQ
jgi:hypothetical protein